MKKMLWMVMLVTAIAAGLLAGCSNASTPPAAKDSAAQPQAAMWTCPMHPEVQEAKAGKCPKCNMDLVQQKDAKK